MKSVRLTGVGVALLAVLALSAMAVASSASAAVTFLLALWLENGVAVSERMLVETEGELLLENQNAPIVNKPAAILCSGLLDGFVGPNSEDEITEVLTLTGAAINLTPLTETGLVCLKEEPTTTCEDGKVWAVNLPWVSELELYVDGTEEGFVILLKPHAGGGNVGWYVECLVLGVGATEECTTATGAALAETVAGGVSGVFSEAFTLLMELPLVRCSGNNAETGVIEGSGLEVTSLAGPLQVSE